MMNQDGTMKTMTQREFEKKLAKFTPQERAYILKMRQTIHVDPQEAR